MKNFKTCLGCGAVHPARKKVCGQCGAKLTRERSTGSPLDAETKIRFHNEVNAIKQAQKVKNETYSNNPPLDLYKLPRIKR